MSDDGAQAGAQYLGRTVGGGRFQLRSLLGAGGMASVYLAYDSVLDRQVAVKTLHTELGREQSFRERFRREAQAVAKLSHTNIVSVFDSGEDEIDGAPVPYIVMEYVEGRPLRSVLDEDVSRHGAMPADKALKITADVLAALEVSHEMGLVHRDIKPGNVMVTRRGVVKVMDFGIARAMQSGVTSMTQTGMVVGTPQYLSPEQALGRGVDARSDLYSVGIMLFELLTGRLPFDADSPLAIAYAHVQEEPVAPSSINRSVPPPLDTMVAQALRKNPNERFPSAEAMRAECARIGGSGAATGAAPVIVGGGPAQSGAGVGQAVFPPLSETGTPPPHSGQQQYAPYAYGPSTPPPVTGPMAQQGYHTPGPYAPQGSQTPPPYRMTQAPPPGGGKRGNGVLVGSLAAGAVVLTVVLVAVAMNSGDGGKDPQAEQSPSATAPQDPTETGTTGATGTGGSEEPEQEKFKPEDTTKTVDVTECTEAREHYSDKKKLYMPGLTSNNLSSVKECIRRAGWKLGKVSYEDENVWGKNMVLDQEPDEFDEFDPKEGSVDLTVSTGQPDS